MSRYKGRTDKAIIEREFPHHVDMLTPPNGFGNRLNEMYDWLTAHGIKYQHGKGWREENPDRQSLWFVRWCFKDAESAKAFAAEFSEFPETAEIARVYTAWLIGKRKGPGSGAARP